MNSPRYEHRQRGPLHLLLHCVGLVMIVAAISIPDNEPWLVVLAVGGMGLVMIGLALCFTWLTVRDEGQKLAIVFGPVGLFQKRIAYEDIDSVEPSRSMLIDGWGIHWIPGRGWTYNLWGFDCVELRLGSGRLRIGSNDADALAEFLAERIREKQGVG